MVRYSATYKRWIIALVIYDSARAKTTFIHNPYFRYFQKCLAPTIVGRCESTSVTRKIEQFFVPSMLNGEVVNSMSFLATHHNNVFRIDTGNIVVGGLIYDVVEYLGFEFAMSDLP